MVKSSKDSLEMNGTIIEISADIAKAIDGLRKHIKTISNDSELADFSVKDIFRAVMDGEDLPKEEMKKKSKKHFSKYKKGQKFQVEIAEVHTHYTDDGKPYNLYRIKGFNTMTFDDYGLDRLVEIAKEDK